MPAPALKTLFTPAVTNWFQASFAAPTATQLKAWQSIRTTRNTLVAAPTGSGKTLAAFLCAIDDLVRQSKTGPLQDQVYVLYVSPLKALSNDIHHNLQAPLEGIEALLQAAGEPPSGIRAMVRTGDTPPGERAKMARRPPQILVTTPESLYLLLTSASGRAMLSAVQSVVVDEIHALAGSKRGSHLALSLARLEALEGAVPRRIGLSATQKPIETIAKFLTGGDACAIVDSGHQRERDLTLELPDSPLTPVMANAVWEEVYDRLAQLVGDHTTTLVFVNTRRLAERVARQLAERLGKDTVMAHHGSLSRRHRHESEQALKAGQVKVLVATASLELGIDIGSVDLVCQLGSPGSMAALLQRVGRSGHSVGGLPKGRLFPLTRDDLVECTAMLLAVEAGELDSILLPTAPLDVLCQHIVAEVSAREWPTEALYHALRRAWPYRALDRGDFDRVVQMLAEGYSSQRGRRGAWLFHDAVNGRLRARPAARLTALQNGGAIPDQFDYDVILVPQGHRLGTLGEDFAFDSVPGDIFQLGNASYRILRTQQHKVLVEDAQGLPPTLPFWFGDRPGRSNELSAAVAGLRETLARRFAREGRDPARDWLLSRSVPHAAAEQLTDYLFAAWEAFGCLPTRQQVVLERFFDDTGDMHLVLHGTFGSRLMRAWGLSLRKRFCKQFNFELQAAALEDCLILSLGETHSFELAEVTGYLKPETVESVLIQALLDAPMFEARWRWNATIALAVQRMRNGKKIPPQWQRNQAEDLVSVVFPDQIACAENLAGPREVPDHPLVKQTIDDCLRDTMDIDGLVQVLDELRSGAISVHCADLVGPSPLAREVISARPYAFLDDGEAEERRTRAISGAPHDLGQASTLNIISVAAQERVRNEAWVAPRNPDELHDALMQLGGLSQPEFTTGQSLTGAPGSALRWPGWFEALKEDGRVTCLRLKTGERFWVAAERLAEWQALHPGAECVPALAFEKLAAGATKAPPADDAHAALVTLLRDRLAGCGPVRPATLAAAFAVTTEALDAALLYLQGQGYAVRMEQPAVEDLWCERRLLARIHRYSRGARREAVRPVSVACYLQFLCRWHALDDPSSLDQALVRLEGWAAPVAAWERFLLRARVAAMSADSGAERRDSALDGQLDQRFLSGELAWFRPLLSSASQHKVIAASPVALVPRLALDSWRAALGDPPGNRPGDPVASPADESSPTDRAPGAILQALASEGALFVPELQQVTGLASAALEQGLRTLVYEGHITADAFSPLRWLLRPERQKARARQRLARGQGKAAVPVGRWSLLKPLPGPVPQSRQDTGQAMTGRDTAQHGSARWKQQSLAVICGALLQRYGVVFRAVLQREPLLPPWRDLLRYLRRMEDRGEVRGGRFIEGFSGEQFALPEVTASLRQPLAKKREGQLTVISALDPLNLGGYIAPGPKTPAQAGNKILLEDGLPVARWVSGSLEMLPGASAHARREAGPMLAVPMPSRHSGGGLQVPHRAFELRP